MPRRPRVDMAGFYHVVNRGVDRRVIYKDDEDHKTFLQILCDASTLYEVKVHAYVMMGNHYHLLIETSKENLSQYMKHVNASYAIYFNKKYKRTGHLWQGRFRSWFVTQESYLYALIAYIEYNPIKAKMVKKLGEYKYSSYIAFSEKEQAIACLQSSLLFEKYPNVSERIEVIEYAHDERILEEIKKASNLVITSVKENKPNIKALEQALKKVKSLDERNKLIIKANKAGLSQHLLSKIVGISQSQIGRVVMKERGRVT